MNVDLMPIILYNYTIVQIIIYFEINLDCITTGNCMACGDCN